MSISLKGLGPLVGGMVCLALISIAFGCTVAVNGTAPSDVGGLAATAGNASVVITWLDPSEDYFDHVELIDGDGVIVGIAKGQEQYTRAGLVNGLAATFTVKAVGTDGLKSVGIQVSATPVGPGAPPAEQPPAEVGSLAAEAGNTSVSLSWTDPDDDGLDYIEVVTPRGLVVQVQKGTGSYEQAGLENDVEAAFTVRTVGLNGLESAGLQASATPVGQSYPPGEEPPAEVTGLIAVPGDGSVSLSWTDPADADLDFLEVVTPQGLVMQVQKGIEAYAQSGLANGVAASFTVRTVGVNGSKSAGLQASATPQAALGNRTVTGRVTTNGIPLRNARLVLLANASSVEAYTDDEGGFSFQAASPGVYSLTPDKTGFVFSPSSYTLVFNGADLTGRDFNGSAATGFKVDPWGNVWDDSARDPKTLALAAQACADLGGRLPTPTEIYRNSRGTGNSLLRDFTESYYLWTNIEDSSANQIVLRTSDGAVTIVSKASAQSYRCYWPNVVPDDDDSTFFEGGNINGSAGDEAFELTINGVEYVMDKVDRAPLNWNAAVRECEFYGGFLPSESFYSVAIQQGLPNGTNNWVYASDFESVDGTPHAVFSVIRWSGTGSTSYSPSGNSSYAPQLSSYRFRCAMVKEGRGLSPVSSLGSSRIDFPKYGLSSIVSSAAAATHVIATDAAIESGGHIPTLHDYHAMVSSGLPGSSSTIWNWTSNYQTANYIGVAQWAPLNLSFAGRQTADVTRVGSTTSYQYRVVYYPLNDAYIGPADADCQGGRFEYSVDLGGGRFLRVWADNQDRTASSLGAALLACQELGGHLASKRDLIELIRHGLPNGSNGWIWTSDPAIGTNQNAVKWTGTGDKATFLNTWGTGATNNAYEVAKSGSYPFRCVWTNEVRVR